MKITRQQLRRLINEVMVGFPDDRAPFDAGAALKSAKKKITKEPVIANLFSDDDDFDAKRQAYSLGSLAADLTDDEGLAADMASDVIMSPAAPDFDLYGDGDYDQPEPEELNPDERFDNPKDSMTIEQSLQGVIKDMMPDLEISGHRKNPSVGQEVTYYLTHDKKYQIVISERPSYGTSEYYLELRRFNPNASQIKLQSQRHDEMLSCYWTSHGRVAIKRSFSRFILFKKGNR